MKTLNELDKTELKKLKLELKGLEVLSPLLFNYILEIEADLKGARRVIRILQEERIKKDVQKNIDNNIDDFYC